MEPPEDEERSRCPGDVAFSCKDLAVWSFQLMISVGFVALTVYWVFEFKGGLDLEKDPLRSPDFHIILTIVGFFFCAQAIVTYQVFLDCKRSDLLVISFILRLCGIICICIGFYVIYRNSHFETFDPFRSTHSFCAMMTCFLFCGQFVSAMLRVIIPLCRQGSTLAFRPLMISEHELFERLVFFNLANTVFNGFNWALSPLMPSADNRTTENTLPVHPESSAEAQSKLILGTLSLSLAVPLAHHMLSGVRKGVGRLVVKVFWSHEGGDEADRGKLSLTDANTAISSRSPQPQAS